MFKDDRTTKKELGTSGIIWLEEPTKYEYVRAGNWLSASPNFKICKGGQRLIGYTKGKFNEPHLWGGLCYYLKPWDRGMPDANKKDGYGLKPYLAPCEAVVFRRRADGELESVPWHERNQKEGVN